MIRWFLARGAAGLIPNAKLGTPERFFIKGQQVIWIHQREDAAGTPDVNHDLVANRARPVEVAIHRLEGRVETSRFPLFNDQFKCIKVGAGRLRRLDNQGQFGTVSKGVEAIGAHLQTDALL